MLVEHNSNSIFRFTIRVKFNPNNKNVLWTINNDGKLAYIKGDDFKNIYDVSSKQKIKITTENPETYEDIKKILF